MKYRKNLIMNDFLRFIFVNIGKTTGVLIGFLLGLFLIIFGFFKTLFIFALVILGFILGKWFDEGISFRKILKSIILSIRERKWH